MKKFWRLRGDEGFSVGITMRSKTLDVASFKGTVDLLDSGWERAHAKELHPRLRSGVEGELGAHLHVHRADDDVQHASGLLLAATRFLAVPEVTLLKQRDPQLQLGVDVKQDVPDIGTPRPVHISREAIDAVAHSLRENEDGLLIDQYGAAGLPLIRAILAPFLRRLAGPRYRCQFSLVLHGSHDERARFVTARAASSEGDCETSLIDQVAEWQRSPARVFAIADARCVLEQVIRVPGDQDIGLWLSGDLLRFLSANRSDLTLKIRLRAFR